MIHFTLYSRSYCHLCDDMLLALRAMEIVEPLSINVVDVDAAEATLLAQYDELVPVLVAAREDQPVQQLCHYFLDEVAVRRFIARA